MAAGGGRVINVSSAAAVMPEFGRPSYTATKLALEGLTEALGHELRDRLAINCVRIDIPIWTEGFDATLPADFDTTGFEDPTIMSDAVLWLVQQKPLAHGTHPHADRAAPSGHRPARDTLPALTLPAAPDPCAQDRHRGTHQLEFGPMLRSRLRFGIFMAPFHPPHENPTACFERDRELVQWLDELGYDEAWIGEHHSAGYEIIASPELFIADVAARTQHIRLGTGVVSLPYHHPLMVADRMIQLDHLTRGRVDVRRRARACCRPTP